MAKIENKTCAVTVTYGNRWPFLKQILYRLLSHPAVINVIVVNNASSYNVGEKVDAMADSRIVLIDCPENLGSAGGYNKGVSYAHQHSDAGFIWLLDDDNLPDAGALDQLLVRWQELKAENDKTALLSLRTDREIDLLFAKGVLDPYQLYLVENDFLGFSVFRTLQNKWHKIAGKKTQHKATTGELQEQVKMPYAPYGGFFFHQEMLDLIGYPDERFYLYADDEEFSYRVTQQGGSIWLIPGSKIRDIDVNDSRVDYKPKKFSSKILDQWDFRMYYRTRNTIYFHKKTTLNNWFKFNMNKAYFMSRLKLLSILSSKQREYAAFAVAVNDGLQENLGKADPAKF